MTLLLWAAMAFGQAEGTAAPTQTSFDLQQALKGVRAKGELYAIIRTTMGDVYVRLYEAEAPRTVANFVGLSRGSKEWFDPKVKRWVKRPLYKAVTCSRVLPDYLIECGDPEGTGHGGPGYTFADELSPGLTHAEAGTLSMANRGPNTNGSLFFITEAPAPKLDGQFTVFGRVVKNGEVVAKIARVPTTGNDRPAQDVIIKAIDIYRSEKAPK